MTNPAPLQVNEKTKHYPIPAAGDSHGPRIPRLSETARGFMLPLGRLD